MHSVVTVRSTFNDPVIVKEVEEIDVLARYLMRMEQVRGQR